MRSPKDFFQPLAIGAPEPVREIPFRPSRMIHFFDPSNAKMAAKVGDIAKKCDVLLGNLEDAIQADNKLAARQGLIDHADSLGAAARYGDGDVQWLTAGAGIQHSEMFPLLKRDASNPAELFQLWLNLPAASKFAKPHFAMFWDQQVPKVTLRDSEGRATRVTVVAGALAEAKPPAPPPESWASQPDSDVAIWTLEMDANAELQLPPAKPGTNRSIYFFEGKEITLGGRTIARGHRIDVTSDLPLDVRNSTEPGQALVLQGRAIGEPVVSHGPFVMNTRAEIAQAIRDYQSTGFGGWPWPSRDPVHGAEPRRFARRPDGTVEEPS